MRAVGISLGILAFGFVTLTVVACDQRTGSVPGAAAKPARVMAATATPAPTGPDAIAHLKASGDELAQRGENEQALKIYQSALRREPNDLGVRYATAIVLSRLNRRDEAIAAFKWVVVNGLPQSEPVRHAESWLRDEGALTGTAEPIAAQDRWPTSARLHGRVTWTDLDPSQATPRVHVIIEGTDASNKGKVYTTAVELNADYEFPSVQPGSYRLTAQSRLVRLWDTNVVIQEGDPTILNLEQSSSVAPANTFLPK
jgi:tetratricopeptide (TPR) repeat protein